MKRPVVHVTIRDEASGTILHTETKSAFNSGIRASEAAIRKIALSERTVYEGERPNRTGDPKFGGSVYTRRWVSKTGRAIVATIEKEASGLEETAREHDEDPAPDAEAAGAQYAQEQLQSDYFTDWVRDQILEASRMDPNDVLPLETQQDAMEIAKNMLQQLQWDTSRDLDGREIANLIGVDSTSQEDVKEFFKGFRETLHTNRAWLADELLEIKSGMGGGYDESWSHDDDSEESRRRRGVGEVRAAERMYHVVAINERTGKKEYLTATPVTHQEALTILSKQRPHKDVRKQLEPVGNTEEKRRRPKAQRSASRRH